MDIDNRPASIEIRPPERPWERSRRAEMGGKIPEADRQRALRKARHTCAACGRVGAKEVDHIVPVSLGGFNDEANYQVLCTACHKDKTAAEARAAFLARRRVEPEKHPGLLRPQ